MTDATKPSGFDLSRLLTQEDEPTFRVPVVYDAEGGELSGFIIVGKNSAEYQANARQVQIDNIVRSTNRKAAIDTATEAGAEVLALTMGRNNRATAISVVKDWFGFSLNGAVAVVDPEMLAKMFDKYPTWQAKVLAALEVDANFLKV